MNKDVYFTLRTGFFVQLAVQENTLVGDIKNILHRTKLTHFKPENMKFICNGNVINNHEFLPNDATIVALAIIPTKNTYSTSRENVLN